VVKYDPAMISRRRQVSVLVLALFALTFGAAATLFSSSAGAYSGSPPVDSTSTSSTLATTSTTAGGSTSGGSTSPGAANPGSGQGGTGVTPPAPSGLATGSSGLASSGGGAAAPSTVQGSKLPFTGSDVRGLIVIALALLIIGVLARRAGRRRRI
jgi:hypothetical protein